MKVQDWMTAMAKTIGNAQNIHVGADPSKPPATTNVLESKDDETAIEISSELTFGFVGFDINEVNQPDKSDDLMMFFDEEVE